MFGGAVLFFVIALVLNAIGVFNELGRWGILGVVAAIFVVAFSAVGWMVSRRDDAATQHISDRQASESELLAATPGWIKDPHPGLPPQDSWGFFSASFSALSVSQCLSTQSGGSFVRAYHLSGQQIAADGVGWKPMSHNVVELTFVGSLQWFVIMRWTFAGPRPALPRHHFASQVVTPQGNSWRVFALTQAGADYIASTPLIAMVESSAMGGDCVIGGQGHVAISYGDAVGTRDSVLARTALLRAAVELLSPPS